MKLMVASAPPLGSAGLVFSLGGLVLGAGARGRPRPTGAEIRRVGLAGTIMLVGGQGLATLALTRLSTSLVATLEATIPLWVAVLSVPFGARVSRATALRLLLGFAAILVVIATAPSAAFSGSGWALLAACVAPALWATGTLLQARPAAMPTDPRTASAIGLSCGGAALLVLAAVTGQLDVSAWAHVSAGSLAAAAALLVLDSLAGFTLYTRLLRTAPPALVSTYAYVVPVVAIVIGTIALGDRLWTGAIIGAAAILAAVALEIRGR